MSHEEDQVVAALADLCKRYGVTTLIQVGAGDGYEAYRVKETTGCRAICIEADGRHPQAYQCLRSGMTLEYHRALIGATDCVMPFYTHPTPDLSGQFPRGDNGEERHDLPQQRLDTFCATWGIVPDALVIDTEGSSMDVLEGCGALLDGLKIVYAEVQNYEMRPGIRPVGQVDALLSAHGMTQHRTLPSYAVGAAQYNMTWVRQ